VEDSQHVLTAALSAGFRESGAVSLNASKAGEINPMVAVRSTGYSFDAIIGFQDSNGNNVAMVDESYLQTLAGIANERFKINEERIARFRSALLKQFTPTSSVQTKPDWEDAETRRQRKREEGLARQQQLKSQSKPVLSSTSPDIADDVDMDGSS
jgi:tRNA wybutosine-synthesizing protein 3